MLLLVRIGKSAFFKKQLPGVAIRRPIIRRHIFQAMSPVTTISSAPSPDHNNKQLQNGSATISSKATANGGTLSNQPEDAQADERPNKKAKKDFDDNGKVATTKAKIVSTDEISECGARLRNGDLVAFPTETVYGLGCHAMNDTAIPKVFQAKERPLNDPLIVHVLDADDACKLWKDDTHQALLCLTKAFWPGPLTLVAKAKPHVPDIVMANTGYVACRSPSHNIARKLLKEARVPIAGPSANKFGHVSPTSAQHVYDDLKYEDVWILDSPEEACNVGVESTVAKLISDDKKIMVLRQGAVAAEEMQLCLHDAGFTDYTVLSKSKATVADHVATVAPGQMLRHYSPNIPSYMISASLVGAELCAKSKAKLQRAVVIDYGSKLVHWKEMSLQYRDLSPSKSPDDAAKAVFDTLRWAEKVENAELILFPIIDEGTTDGLLLALQDRLTRAASGEQIDTLI